ncbi:FimV/HubP family polar landmark protein, partial [Vibrio sp. 10N.286.49.B3]|uniref:FimV/HubP family polar landmark protein n=1 Tax=Vibrio sp. 10N.286.49.B3 TaxID=1880855 RepID=UPI0024115E47
EDSGLSDVALDDSSAEPQNELLDNTDSGVEKSALDESSFETLDLESLEHDNKAFDDLAPEPSNLDASPLENSVEDSSAELLDESPKQEASPLSAAIENEFGIPQDEDWQIDESDLPHYNEEDAQFDLPDAAEIEAPQAPVAENNKVEIDDSQLPEYSEDEAFAENAIESLLSDAGEALGEQEVETNHNDIQVSDYNDQDALHDLFSSNIENETPLETPISEDKPSEDKTFNESIQPDAQLDDSDNGQLSSADIIDEFDEKTLNTLLSEPAEGEFAPPHRTHAFDGQDIDSAGMDIDAMLDMGGEDWNGFSLSDEQKSTIDNEVPEDEQSAWLGGEKPAEAIVQAEDWAQQADFESQKEQFMTIDELMAQVELGEEKGNLDDEELNLDVGLNEFPDVIGNADGVDVDNNAEAAGKLDLAKIYMEMNDNTGAIKLLEAAIVDGDDMIRREAKNLIDTINRA